MRAEASTLKIGWICLQSDVKGSIRMRAHCKLAGNSTTVMLKDAWACVPIENWLEMPPK